MTKTEIVSLAVNGGQVLLAIFIYIIGIIRAKKKMSAREALDPFIRDMVKLAEECKDYSGEEKKKFVLTRVKEYLLEKSNAYIRKYLSESVIDQMIEDEVALTNAVNVDKKNKGVA